LRAAIATFKPYPFAKHKIVYTKRLNGFNAVFLAFDGNVFKDIVGYVDFTTDTLIVILEKFLHEPARRRKTSNTQPGLSAAKKQLTFAFAVALV
jgi:hypothetical protein